MYFCFKNQEMAIKYQDVRHDRQWKASTGLSEDQFLKLALDFGKAYEDMFGVSMQERQSNSRQRVPSKPTKICFSLLCSASKAV